MLFQSNLLACCSLSRLTVSYTNLCGLHINEDHFLVEVVDPETLEPVDEGEDGELIVTPLSKEAFPLLRYRTRDISNVIYEPCKCGRTFARMEKVKGRSCLLYTSKK